MVTSHINQVGASHYLGGPVLVGRGRGGGTCNGYEGAWGPLQGGGERAGRALRRGRGVPLPCRPNLGRGGTDGLVYALVSSAGGTDDHPDTFFP